MCIVGLLIYSMFFGHRGPTRDNHVLALESTLLQLERAEEMYEIHPDDVADEKAVVLDILQRKSKDSTQVAQRELKSFMDYHKEMFRKRQNHRHHDDDDDWDWDDVK